MSRPCTSSTRWMRATVAMVVPITRVAGRGWQGIVVPQDTYFIAGQHNTTTDEVELFDLEDLPATHRKDVLQLVRDLEKAVPQGRFVEHTEFTRKPEVCIVMACLASQ